MSRAFTKEIDDAPPPRIEDRPISGAPNFVTARGAELIKEQVRRLGEAALAASAERLPVIRRDLRYWSVRVATMQIISIPISPLEVQFGSTVELRRGDKMMRVTIVGEDEAEPADGLIAWTSPLARAIEGAEVGELILLDGRGEPEKIEILALRG